jgi:hypothetical protein
MKSKLSVFATAAALCAFTLPAWAAQTQTENGEANQSRPTYGHSRAGRPERLGQVSKASEVLG